MAGGLLLIVLLAQVLWQVSYSDEKTVPYAELYGHNVGNTSRVRLSATIQKDFQKDNLHLRTTSTDTTIALKDIGATVNADRMAANLTAYPLGIRLIPFSILWQHPRINSYDLSFDQGRLATVSTALAKDLTTKPQDASLAIKKGKLVVTPARTGQSVTDEAVRHAIISARMHTGRTEVNVASAEKAPAVPDSAIGPVKTEAESIIGRTYRLLTPDGDTIIPSKSAIASWLQVIHSKGKYSLEVSQSALKKYANGLTAKAGTSPTSTRINLVDGKERSRHTGKTGKAVDADDLAIKLKNAIDSQETSVAIDIVLKPVAPR